MTDFNTGNAVPSSDPRDLDDNATVFDRLLNASLPSVPDRLGTSRKTWHQMELDALALVSPNVASLASLIGAADRGLMFTALNTLGMFTLTAQGRAFLAAASQAAQIVALGGGSANGVATLGADGKLPVAQLPPLAINDTFTVASQAAMLALTAQRGDVAIRSDLAGAAYLLTADAPTVLANWVPIQQNLGAALQALAALTPAADKLAYFASGSTAALADFTAVARSLLAATNQAGQRAALGVLAQTDKPAWTNYTPVVTASGGTFTTASATGRYIVLFGICHFRVDITITTVGTGAGAIFSLPVAADANSLGHMATAREGVNSGKMGYSRILTGLATARCVAYDNGDLVSGNGSVITINGSYPVA